VSLPKNWAKKYGIKRGSFLSISERSDGCLIIEPISEKVEEIKKVSILCSGKSIKRIEWEIIGAYLLGFEVIEINAKERMEAEIRSRIKTVVQNLIGLEILEENSKRILINCLLDHSAVNPKRLLEREHVITMSMHKDVIHALIEGDLNLAKSVMNRDDEVDRIYFLTVRLLRSAIQSPKLADKFKITPIECLDYRLASSLIESIGDYSADAAKASLKLLENKNLSNITEELKLLSNILCKMQNSAVGAFMARKVKLVEEVKVKLNNKLSEVLKNLDNAINILPSDVISCFLAILSSFEKIGKCCIDIADLVIPLEWVGEKWKKL